MSLVRCFIAVDVDDDEIKGKIDKVQETLHTIGLRVKNVESENIHLTLKFLGEIAESQVEEVKDALSGIEFESFQLRFKGLGTFPNPRRPRVIWLGTSEGIYEISQLAENIDKRLKRARFPPESRRFKSHLTIARVKYGGGPALINLIQSHSQTEFGCLNVDSVKLKKSDLTPKGPIYTTLQTWRATQV